MAVFGIFSWSLLMGMIFVMFLFSFALPVPAHADFAGSSLLYESGAMDLAVAVMKKHLYGE